MTSGGAVIILQARMASKRLPGKAMAELAGRTLIARCLDRLKVSGTAPVMLATTRRAEDDELVRAAEEAGATVFRGSEDNVLRRYVSAARAAGADVVVRATADNPAIDLDAPARVLEALRAADADHAMDVDLPVGSAVEAVTVRALSRALESTGNPFDLEHVTPFIRRERTLFRVVETPAPPAVRRPDLRFTIDTPEDLRFMQRVLGRLGDAPAEWPLTTIIEAADQASDCAVAS
jgi:spore coat polysaccharide biosynthesis protein SpsF